MNLWSLRTFLLLLPGVVLPVSGVCRPDDLFNKFGRKACGKGFCFDITLTLVVTGPFDINPVLSGDGVLDHYALVGFDMSQTIAEGRRAIAYYLDRYGVAFTSLTDDQVLRGIHTDLATGATFSAMVVDSDESLRLYQVATRCGFDFLNVPVEEAGWILTFPVEHSPTGGTFNEVIPAGAFSVFTSYIIDICGHKGHPNRFCPSILRSDRSRSPIFIRVMTRTYLLLTPPFTEPFIPINCALESEDFGKGVVRGIYFPIGRRPIDGRVVIDGKIIATFPATKPFPP